MIDIKLYEKNLDFQKAYQKNLENRKTDIAPLNSAVELNKERKKIIREIEQLIVSRKEIEKKFFTHSSGDDTSKEKKTFHLKAQRIGEDINEKKKVLKKIEANILSNFSRLPNICHKSVPIGFSDKDNQLIKKQGDLPQFSFPTKSHLELAKKEIDMDRASKIAGSRFCFLRGSIAQLERALAHYMLDVHIKKHGYEELYTPLIVREKTLFNTGQLPKFEQDVFLVPFQTQEKTQKHFLIPTAEVSVTNFFSDEILLEKDLPTKFVTYSSCFRSEAGAYGTDTKGLIRQHQFTKVELVIFAHPKNSYDELENLCSHAEQILKNLEIPYRIVSLCTGDIGFSASKCYDIEAWIPSEKKYREISSCSNCENYQSRRGNIRFRSSSGLDFVHTLNGSGLAVGRTLIALLENYQNEDGSVRIPSALQPYMSGKKIILTKK